MMRYIFILTPSVLGPYRLSVRNETKGESLSHYLVCTLNTSDSYSMNSYCNTNTYNSFIDYYNNGGSIYTTIPIYSDINKTEVFFFQPVPTEIPNPDDSGSGGNTPGDDGGSEDSNSGWFSSIIDFLGDIFSAIGNLASGIASAIGQVFSGLFNTVAEILNYINPFSENFILKDIINFLGNLLSYINPFSDNFIGYKLIELLGDLLEWLFIPSDDYFTVKFTDMKDGLLSKLSYDSYISALESINNANVSNTVVSLDGYTVGNTTVSNSNFINFDFITQHKDTWFSWIRGICFILLALYNINSIYRLVRNEDLVNSGGVKNDN